MNKIDGEGEKISASLAGQPGVTPPVNVFHYCFPNHQGFQNLDGFLLARTAPSVEVLPTG